MRKLKFLIVKAVIIFLELAVDLFKLDCHEFVDKLKYKALTLLIHPTLPVSVRLCAHVC